MRLPLALLAACVLATPAFAAGPKRVPVVIDTDIGGDIDDAFALALAVTSPELDILGVTTVGRGGELDPFVQHIDKTRDEDRAWLVCRFLTQVGRKDVPVAAGADPQPVSPLDWQIQYRRHPAAIYNRTLKPVKEPAAELIARIAKEKDGELVVICLGPLTNIARLLKDSPEAARKVKRFVVMGGSVAVGYDGVKKAEPEWNSKTDVPAAKAVFASGIPMTVVPLDATATLKLEKKDRDAVFAARSMLTYQVQNLYELWDKETPIFFDPAAVLAAFDDRHFTWKDLRLEVDDTGMTLVKEGKANARVATAVKGDAVVAEIAKRLREHGEEALPLQPKNASKLIEPGMFPARVHVCEDYDTDIEKRWWMCGKLETADVPTKGGRAQRAVLTQDFDDKQGHTDAMYRAVIFNPVPGPPMGPNTRLRFKYKVKGTITIHVQLYSLTKGYHRYLSVSGGLGWDKWQEACVDMTQMRRPDGTGGPLARDERIDDIQFYVDPRAELLIDDVVLFEAAAEGEKRPFPNRMLFTAGFDTGKHGVHWPGDFEIVDHEKPRTWKAAKSVLDTDGKPRLTVGMRGERALGGPVDLTFRYRFTGSGDIAVGLSHGKGAPVAKAAFTPKAGEWAEATLKFQPGKDAKADAITFVLPDKSELLIDDVLLYAPGR